MTSMFVIVEASLAGEPRSSKMGSVDGYDQANAQQILKTNRGHWCIENSCHYVIDWNYDEDRSRIRTGHGPENLTRLRRFAVGLIKSKDAKSVAQKMRQLTMNVRLVFDYLRMTKNTQVVKAG